MRKIIWTFGISIFLTGIAAEARLFRNAYLQFDLPANWDCQMEGTEWVCSSKNKLDSRESIIILTAKEVGAQDSLAAYEAYLKRPKTLMQQNGRAASSTVKSIKQRKINSHPWVDALHLGSEIPNYYTRYLATVKDKLAILITLSAHQKYYTKYSNEFFKAVESLQVVATKDILSPKNPTLTRPVGESLGQNPNPVMPLPRDAEISTEVPPESEGQNNNTIFMGLGIILMAIAGYLFLKKK